MADINITVDTTQVVRARSELDSLGLTVTKQAQTVQRLERYYKQLDRAFNTGKLSAQQYAKGVKQLDAAIDGVNSGQIALTKSQQRLTTSTNQATSALSNQAAVLQQSQKAHRRFEVGVQQAGYQVGDFFVQVASGTNPMVAFTQQATQLAGFFAGPWGAIIGAALSIFGAVAIVMGATGDKTTELSFNFKKFGEDMKVAIEPLMPLFRLLADVFGIVKNAIINSINAVLNAFRMLGAAVGALPESFSSLAGLVDAQMFRLELVVRSYAASIKAIIQGMFDFMSGGPAMMTNAGDQAISVAESYRKESEYYQAMYAKERISDAIDDRRNRIIKAMAKARLNGEVDQEALQQAKEFNSEHPSRRITGESVSRSVAQRKKDKQQRSESGVRYEKRERDIRDVTRYAN